MKNDRHRWIAEVHAADRDVLIVALEELSADADWREREKHWIGQSENLKNTAPAGGGGGPRKTYPPGTKLLIYGLVDSGAARSISAT